eukprot:COSAG01_NODE_7985_length_2965_cov_1.040823_5_plen_177_part_00
MASCCTASVSSVLLVSELTDCRLTEVYLGFWDWIQVLIQVWMQVLPRDEHSGVHPVVGWWRDRHDDRVFMARRQLVSRPFPFWNRSISAEIYLCHACSCHKILRGATAGQATRHREAWVQRDDRLRGGQGVLQKPRRGRSPRDGSIAPVLGRPRVRVEIRGSPKIRIVEKSQPHPY